MVSHPDLHPHGDSLVGINDETKRRRGLEVAFSESLSSIRKGCQEKKLRLARRTRFFLEIQSTVFMPHKEK